MNTGNPDSIYTATSGMDGLSKLVPFGKYMISLLANTSANNMVFKSFVYTLESIQGSTYYFSIESNQPNTVRDDWNVVHSSLTHSNVPNGKGTTYTSKMFKQSNVLNMKTLNSEVFRINGNAYVLSGIVTSIQRYTNRPFFPPSVIESREEMRARATAAAEARMSRPPPSSIPPPSLLPPPSSTPPPSLLPPPLPCSPLTPRFLHFPWLVVVLFFHLIPRKQSSAPSRPRTNQPLAPKGATHLYTASEENTRVRSYRNNIDSTARSKGEP